VSALMDNNSVSIRSIMDEKIYSIDIKPVEFISDRQREMEVRHIEQLRLERLERAAKASEYVRMANYKAKCLLRTVCGDELYQEFESRGQITVQNEGYTFEIAPSEFVKCTDPNGKKAKLCIHTQALSCNPIDELVIAYLNIKK